MKNGACKLYATPKMRVSICFDSVQSKFCCVKKKNIITHPAAGLVEQRDCPALSGLEVSALVVWVGWALV